ncbi:beta-ketoacyl synthase N-terminal-like domain-containing protein [Mycolicibacterium farcinogenes]|uniref:beta-ketoacyl synthase N-terminal-like domain-containing protein n=1 Tax=Mycolicibacterium farcinogenes TaxID=1802 RepID=UPI003F4952D0
MGTADHPTETTAGFAVIGYAARFPGAPDAEAFWDVLREGRDAVSEIPQDRWDADEFFDPEPGSPGKVVTRRAGFVDDVTGFDAPFFGMSTREVRLMDPQHRTSASRLRGEPSSIQALHQQLWPTPTPVCSSAWPPTTTWEWPLTS